MGLVDRGSEISTDLIASKLAKKHKVMVLSAGKLSNKKYQHQQIPGPTTPPPPAPTNLLQKLLFRLGLNDANKEITRFTIASLPIVKKFNPDIIIPVNGAQELRIIKKNFSQLKTAVFGRAGIGHDDLKTLRAKPNLFIALTKQAESWALQRHVQPTKVSYIPNPINISEFKRSKPAELDLVRPIILTVGALTAYKNIIPVIRAVSYLKASLLLVGDGEERDSVAQTLSELDNEFSWIKHLEPNELPSYYASSHVFCFVPDKQEAFGRVYLEAMSAGLPIVASDDPIRRSIVGKYGYYANPHDPLSIAREIEKAVKGKKKIDYTNELKPYQTSAVIKKLEKELNALI